jgi:hypothetical protein
MTSVNIGAGVGDLLRLIICNGGAIEDVAIRPRVGVGESDRLDLRHAQVVRIVDLGRTELLAVSTGSAVGLHIRRIVGDFDRPAAVLLLGAGDAGAGQDPDPRVALEPTRVDLHAA